VTGGALACPVQAGMAMEDLFGNRHPLRCLQRILADTGTALAEIDRTIVEIRAFLIKEFGFKESF
jgi:hypothetical protein